MQVFYVWDELNHEPEDAKKIEALYPADAACTYAENDSDGWTDGLYHDCAQPLIVRNEDGSQQWRIEVRAEMVPRIFAGEPKLLGPEERYSLESDDA